MPVLSVVNERSLLTTWRGKEYHENVRVLAEEGGGCEGVWSCGGVCGAGEADGNAVFEGDGGGPSSLLGGCELIWDQQAMLQGER